MILKDGQEIFLEMFRCGFFFLGGGDEWGRLFLFADLSGLGF